MMIHDSMANTQYVRGRSFEYRVKDKLIDKGYFVMRSPQSKGAVDLLAVNNGVALFVQCKLTGIIGVDEWNNLFDLANEYGAIPIIATSDKRKTKLYQIIGKAELNERERILKKTAIWME